MGVEEEYFVVDRAGRAVTAVGPRLSAHAVGALGDLGSGEFADRQVELRTPPCADLAVCSLQGHVYLPDREVAALVGNHLRLWYCG
ncbi:glutamate-cysteine ligase family protein [Kitasatospora sp. NPDC059463]|uniref:glutamate-cysteine ligase family protein n=1 Tax=unclassified Kitasatospora TaxID=2633591 RepID=UPI0036C179A3